MSRWRKKKKGPNFVLEEKAVYNEGEVNEMSENNAEKATPVDDLIANEAQAPAAPAPAEAAPVEEKSDEDVLNEIAELKNERFLSSDVDERDRLKSEIQALAEKLDG